jgi:hypothetical protein
MILSVPGMMCLAEAPGHGRPDVAPRDLVLKPFDHYAGGGELSFELGDLAREPLQARLAVTPPGPQVPFQAADLEAQGIGRFPLLLRLDLRAEDVQLSDIGTCEQARHALSLLAA